MSEFLAHMKLVHEKPAGLKGINSNTIICLIKLCNVMI